MRKKSYLCRSPKRWASCKTLLISINIALYGMGVLYKHLRFRRQYAYATAMQIHPTPYAI